MALLYVDLTFQFFDQSTNLLLYVEHMDDITVGLVWWEFYQLYIQLTWEYRKNVTCLPVVWISSLLIGQFGHLICIFGTMQSR